MTSRKRYRKRGRKKSTKLYRRRIKNKNKKKSIRRKNRPRKNNQSLKKRLGGTQSTGTQSTDTVDPLHHLAKFLKKNGTEIDKEMELDDIIREFQVLQSSLLKNTNMNFDCSFLDGDDNQLSKTTINNIMQAYTNIIHNENVKDRTRIMINKIEILPEKELHNEVNKYFEYLWNVLTRCFHSKNKEKCFGKNVEFKNNDELHFVSCLITNKTTIKGYIIIHIYNLIGKAPPNNNLIGKDPPNNNDDKPMAGGGGAFEVGFPMVVFGLFGLAVVVGVCVLGGGVVAGAGGALAAMGIITGIGGMLVGYDNYKEQIKSALKNAKEKIKSAVNYGKKIYSSIGYLTDVSIVVYLMPENKLFNLINNIDHIKYVNTQISEKDIIKDIETINWIKSKIDQANHTYDNGNFFASENQKINTYLINLNN